MALYTKKEFCSLVGIKTKDLSVYVKRGKVNLKGDLIDDTDQVNVLFMAGRKSKSESGDQKVKTVRVSKEPVPPTEKEIDDKNTLLGITKDKKELEVLKIRNEIAMQRMEILKKSGEVVPTESMKNLFVMHSESIKTAYTEASDNLIIIIAQDHGLNAGDVAKLRKQFIQIVNKAIDSAVNATQMGLDKVASEFSKKRGVGQHD